MAFAIASDAACAHFMHSAKSMMFAQTRTVHKPKTNTVGVARASRIVVCVRLPAEIAQESNAVASKAGANLDLV